jgi:hypothetical protein
MTMKKALVERSIVILLFVLVMVVFSFAERDTKKIFQQNPRGTVILVPQTPELQFSGKAEPIAQIPVDNK